VRIISARAATRNERQLYEQGSLQSLTSNDELPSS
jgi:hypothetical protein